MFDDKDDDDADDDDNQEDEEDEDGGKREDLAVVSWAAHNNATLVSNMVQAFNNS